ncbi:MAG: polysaccharide deacetylase family protein [Lachnospiraceae bacterium]|nr:polysaccharide deacetylase family protein [Lachnospiraceae bacterium]
MKTIYVKDIAGKLRRHARAIITAVFLCSMFFLGREVARFREESAATPGQSSGVEIRGVTENWGLGFGQSGEKPTGNATVEQLKQYNAYYMAEGDEKVIYLTFDCGYENGNTEPILDALKKHNAPATFFVVGHFLESAPDMVKRMVEEGHTVGNHTYHHYDMSKIADLSSFQEETDSVADKFKEVTGTELSMYYRPPQGKYSAANLEMAKELGYSTFFWSLAYVDWNQDDQPSRDEAMEKLLGRIHPGAIVLLHNTSKTNGEILDELLTKWEEMGYTFRPLSDFVQQ